MTARTTIIGIMAVFILGAFAFLFINNKSMTTTSGLTADNYGQVVTLDGTAFDAKGGAVVKLEDGSVVYLEGVESWPDEALRQKVSVTGKLVEKKLIPDPVVEDGLYSAGAEGPQDVLENATWKVVQ